MTTTLELEAARDLWMQARRFAVYEHRALILLITSRKDMLESSDKTIDGAVTRKGTAQYRKQLSDHVARVQAALEHLDKMATNFHAAQARWREAELKRTAASAKSRAVIYPAKVVFNKREPLDM